jgi:hypothetical protein
MVADAGLVLRFEQQMEVDNIKDFSEEQVASFSV